MRMMAKIANARGVNQVSLESGGRATSIAIPPKDSGFGSSASGGELLLLALAACYCNDLYREAARMGVEVTGVEVECAAEFAAEGQAAGEVTYRARITSHAPEAKVRELAMITDRRAEIHATVRQPIAVTLAHVEVIAA